MTVTPNTPARWRRPSAVLVLGTLSGLLAGALYMAISVPLVLMMIQQEEENAVRRSATLAERIDQLATSGELLDQQLFDQLDAVGVRVTIRESGTQLFAIGVDDDVARQACELGNSSGKMDVGRETFGVTCHIGRYHQTVTLVRPSYRSGRQVLYWTGLLALVVGLVTALGQARALRPLTEMSRALEQVGRGGRVSLRSTGLAEFDALVDRINEASSSVEERVDAITARITVVQEMARIVAHEVRNPLQSLELLTSLIADEKDASERRAIADSIRTEIRALDQVVHRLLREGASKGALRLRRRLQPVVPLVEAAIAVHGAAARRKGVRISVGLLTSDAAPIDATMLGRAIENLLTNAIEAVHEKDGEIRISVMRDAEAILITVDDNGPGVPEELGDSIFESDITGRPDGHGVGLALVRGVLIAHDGSIEYSTSPLGGARFVARVPLASSEETDA